MTSQKPKRGRPKATEISVTAQKQISALRMRFSLPDAVLTYRDVARELTSRAGFPVSAATVWNFANGKELRATRLRRLFGFPVLLPAVACPVHGVVHPGTCPKAKPTPPAWVSLAATWLAGRAASTPTTGQVYGRRGQAVGR